MNDWIHRTILAAALLAGSGCVRAAPTPATAAPRALPPDSAALLIAALRSARPAFSTQEEALLAGIYEPPAGHQRSARPGPPIEGQPPTAEPAAAYVIQIAAFSERAAAERAAVEAERHFAGRSVVIEATSSVYRVALAGWHSASAAAVDLPAIQRFFPGAWIRKRGIS